MVLSLHAPSQTNPLSHAPLRAMTTPLPGSHAHDDVRTMVVFLISTLALWLSARVTLY